MVPFIPGSVILRPQLRGPRRSTLVAAALVACLSPAIGTSQNRNSERNSERNRARDVERAIARETRDRFRGRLDTTVAVAAGTTIDVSMSSGRIVVKGWDRQAVEVHAHSEGGDIEFSYAAPVLRLSSNVSRRVRGQAGDAVLELQVPRGSRVLTFGTTGDIAILDVGGDAEARTMRGDVQLRGLGRRTIVETMTGDLSLSGAEGDVRITTLSGDLVLDDVRGNIDIGCTSGDVMMRGIRSSSVRVSATEADITYDGTVSASGRYEFTTHSGDVQLFLAEGSKGTLDMQSFSGELHTRFPLTQLPNATATAVASGRSTASREAALRQRHWFEFGGAGGGASVSISTFSGDINIDRGPMTGSVPVRKR